MMASERFCWSEIMFRVYWSEHIDPVQELMGEKPNVFLATLGVEEAQTYAGMLIGKGLYVLRVEDSAGNILAERENVASWVAASPKDAAGLAANLPPQPHAPPPDQGWR